MARPSNEQMLKGTDIALAACGPYRQRTEQQMIDAGFNVSELDAAVIATLRYCEMMGKEWPTDCPGMILMVGITLAAQSIIQHLND